MSVLIEKSGVTVSVLLSTYNDVSTIESAISSVLNQTYDNFEFIIVNDASTDATAEVLNKFSENDRRITVYSNIENMGLTRSLNRGLTHCTGVYIARIDADDLWHKDKLGEQLDYMFDHPECALLGTAYEEIDDYGEYFRASTVPLFTNDGDLRSSMVRFNPFFHSSAIVRKDVIELLNGYDESCRYAQDYNLWVRIAEKYNIANLPNVLAYRRIMADNISVKKEKQQRISALRSKVLAIKLLDNNFLNYRYLLNDMAVIVLPTVLVSLIRSLK